MTIRVLLTSRARCDGTEGSKGALVWGLPSSSRTSVTSTAPAAPSGSVAQTGSLLATMGMARTNERSKSRTPGAEPSAPNGPVLPVDPPSLVAPLTASELAECARPGGWRTAVGFAFVVVVVVAFVLAFGACAPLEGSRPSVLISLLVSAGDSGRACWPNSASFWTSDEMP